MGIIRNVLLTGVTGYLGSNLAIRLLDEGYKLIVLKRRSSNLDRINKILDEITIFDVEDTDYDQLFRTHIIDAVIHTAASYGRNGESLIEVYDANVNVPLRILQYAIKHGVRYFFNSATTLPSNLNIYALSKNHFSDIAKMNSDKITVVDIKLEYFYGPYDDVSKFVTYIISSFKDNKAEIDLSPCTQVRDFIYISDVVDAYSKLLRNLTFADKYNVIPLGTGTGIRMRQLIEIIQSHFPNADTKLNFGALPIRNNEVMYSVSDIEYLNNIGWSPKYDISQGIKLTVDIEKKYTHDSN